MTQINLKQLQKVLYKVVYNTYLQALIVNTPGDGNVANAWDIEITEEAIIVYNEDFGDIIKFLNDGTEPYVIKPKPGNKFLRFKKPEKRVSKKHSPIKGNVTFEKDGYIYTKEVHHPGIQARRFIQKVMSDESLVEKFETMLNEELIKLVK